MYDSKGTWIVVLLLLLAFGYVAYPSVSKLINNNNSTYYQNTQENRKLTNEELGLPTPSDMYYTLQSGTWLSENEYINEELDFHFVLPNDWRYAFNAKDGSVTMASNYSAESLSVQFNTTTLEEQQDLVKAQFTDETNKVTYLSFVRINGIEYSCVEGYTNDRGLDWIEHKCFLRMSKNGKYVITIHTNFPFGCTPNIADIFINGETKEFEILSEENIKAPELSIEDIYDGNEIRVPANFFEKYGTWDKNVYTSDILDLKVTIPNNCGYYIGIDNYFNITPGDIGTKDYINIYLTEGTPEDARKDDEDKFVKDYLDQTYKEFTASISGQNYIGFIEDNGNGEPDIRHYYREASKGEYLLVITTNLNPNSNDIFTKILERNGNKSYSEAITKTINSSMVLSAYDVFSTGESDEKSYKNKTLGFKITCPEGWETFRVYPTSISISEKKRSLL